MTINVGDRLPDVPLTVATAEGPEQTTSTDFFAGRRVALFAVPGAFTPTCSARHLPSYVEKASELKSKGVDEIACISVNDAFVMGAWNKADGSDDITMLADGNGAFADAVGLTMDGSKFGMGKKPFSNSFKAPRSGVRRFLASPRRWTETWIGPAR